MNINYFCDVLKWFTLRKHTLKQPLSRDFKIVQRVGNALEFPTKSFL